MKHPVLVASFVALIAVGPSGEVAPGGFLARTYEGDAGRGLALVPTALNDLRTVQNGRSTVRGLLFRLDPRGARYPAPGIPVRLNHPQYGPSNWVYSGGDGMYYLQNIGAGQFTLEVMVNREQVLRYQITVFGDRPFTDIAPIQVP